MNLFQKGDFSLHSGKSSEFKIDCDSLTDEDIDTIAFLLSKRLPLFGEVQGVPRGGLRLAEAMKQFVMPPRSSDYPLLIVDDVLTSGGSMEKHRKDYGGPDTIGAVIFDRGEAERPGWITALFTMSMSMSTLGECEMCKMSYDIEQGEWDNEIYCFWCYHEMFPCPDWCPDR